MVLFVLAVERDVLFLIAPLWFLERHKKMGFNVADEVFLC